MNFLEERILRDGKVREGDILQVGSFLNHQIDVELLNRLGEEFKRRFADCDITKILTIEASGIGVACIAAQYFNVPVLFAKKGRSLNVSGDIFSSVAYSYTHKHENFIFVSADYLSKDDRVLIIDDFLANGASATALCDIVCQSGATVEGIGIAIEKKYQGGGELIRSRGYRLESIAVIESMDSDKGEIVFHSR